MNFSEILHQNRVRVTHLIEESAKKAGRKLDEVSVLLASKYLNLDQIKDSIREGLLLFGENKIQEAVQKIEKINDNRVNWHFIGHLQSRKSALAVKHFKLIHSVDSIELMRKLDVESKKLNKIQDILIQVNTSGENTKFGIKSEETQMFVESASSLHNINVAGLMAMAPAKEKLSQPEKEIRETFSSLRVLRDGIRDCGFPQLKELSMGMSGDFQIAVEEGATILRLGSVLIGEQ